VTETYSSCGSVIALSSAFAINRSSPVSFLSLAARLVRITSPRVSTMNMMAATKRTPAALQKDRTRQKNRYSNTESGREHEVEPLDPSPLEARVDLNPAGCKRTKAGPAEYPEGENRQWDATSVSTLVSSFNLVNSRDEGSHTRARAKYLRSCHQPMYPSMRLRLRESVRPGPFQCS
jgi:hypothetical protein